jgi:hypothetical protein
VSDCVTVPRLWLPRYDCVTVRCSALEGCYGALKRCYGRTHGVVAVRRAGPRGPPDALHCIPSTTLLYTTHVRDARKQLQVIITPRQPRYCAGEPILAPVLWHVLFSTQTSHNSPCSRCRCESHHCDQGSVGRSITTEIREQNHL